MVAMIILYVESLTGSYRTQVCFRPIYPASKSRIAVRNVRPSHASDLRTHLGARRNFRQMCLAENCWRVFFSGGTCGHSTRQPRGASSHLTHSHPCMPPLACYRDQTTLLVVYSQFLHPRIGTIDVEPFRTIPSSYPV